MTSLAEILDVYNRKGELIARRERKALFKEWKERYLALAAKGKKSSDINIGEAVNAFFLILKNSKDKFYIVQRANKDENPLLYDKTVGGHVISKETPDSALVRESDEELGINIMLVKKNKYATALKTADLKHVAVVKKVKYLQWVKSVRLDDSGNAWIKNLRLTIYAGVYDGKISFIDEEAKSYKLMSSSELGSALRKSPNKFTYDIKFLESKRLFSNKIYF